MILSYNILMKTLKAKLWIITVLISVMLLLLYIFSEKPDEKLSDQELREKALSLGLKPVPTTYKELLKIIDNPQNPMTPAKIALGEKLFFDKILSYDRDISCASCHKLKEGGDDNIPTAIGHKGQKNPSHLNSPTVLNAALAKAQFWDGRAKDVEEQAGGPIKAPFEMNLTPKEVEKRLKNSPSYVKEFKEVFDGNISFENVQKAIGAYERTLLTYGKFDDFLNGDDNAIDEKAKRGLNLFIDKGCKGCHVGMSIGGQSIQKFPLRPYKDWFNINFDPNVNIYDQPFPFENIGGFLGQNNHKKFRVPILRNITKTSPYFHNGAIKEIEEAVRIMGKHQIGVDFTKEQIDDIVAFLKTLEGEIVNYD